MTIKWKRPEYAIKWKRPYNVNKMEDVTIPIKWKRPYNANKMEEARQYQ